MSSRTFPIPVTELTAWLPHRPPMVWIDEVSQVTQNGGECKLRLNGDALYMSTDGIRQSAMVEWLAQSFGYIRAVQNICGLIPQAPPPSRTLLISIRDAHYHLPLHQLDLGREEVLRFQVGNIKELSPLLVFDGTVLTAKGVRLFSARMTGYSA